MQATYLEAIRQGLGEEMGLDPRVFIIGEDVGAYGGAFKVTKGFLEKFGPPRDHRDRLPFECFAQSGAPISAEAQRFADVAASVQLVIEERLLELARMLHERVPSEHLCYAGGVSLNCVANRRLLTEGPFRTVYVPPDPGDGGTSVGAALPTVMRIASSTTRPVTSAHGIVNCPCGVVTVRVLPPSETTVPLTRSPLERVT